MAQPTKGAKKKAAAAPKGAAKPAKPAAPKKVAPRPLAPKAKPAPAAAPAARGPNPFDIVFHPVVTEKTMFNMDNHNALEFLVRTTATKPEIKKAVEELFTVKVDKVTTRITKDGKRAIVTFAEGHSAEDVGTRIGVF